MSIRPPELRDFPDYEGQIEHSRRLERRTGGTVPSGEVLPSALAERLPVDLWGHQARALRALRHGEDVCVSTATASGKTYVYALHIARVHLEDPASTALLVYPTRALSADQKEELDALYDRLNLDLRVGVYDGDATTEQKRAIRDRADVVITNYAGLNQYLPHHHLWERIYRNLRTVVVEEAHAYSGILGIHAAWITRRLRRVVESDLYGADPRFVLTSATIGNPSDHARRLTGREVTVVDRDDSPRRPRDLVLWNPPKYDEDAPYRKSTHRESSRLLAHLVDRGHQTLMFAPSRKMTELDARWARESLRERSSDGNTVEPYHAGHLKSERRRVEEGLREGSLDGVVSTTALELGINIGSVDAAILSGYPGSRQSFWQQAGRAGRDDTRVLNVLVAHESALDQYIMHHPEYLLEESVEDAVVDLNNNAVYVTHLAVAASEMPLTRHDTVYFGERLERAVDYLKRKGDAAGNLDTKVHYVGDDRPEADINLYGSGTGTFEVRLRDGDEVVTLDRAVSKQRAYRDFHPGAVYLHRGRQYRVEAFQEDPQPVVELTRTDVDYYTDAVRKPRIQNVETHADRSIGSFQLRRGRGEVEVHYPLYRCKDIGSQTVKDTRSTELDDPVTLRTDLLWLEVPESLVTSLRSGTGNAARRGEASQQDPFLGGIHAVEHGLVHMAPTELLIEKRDLGGLSVPDHPETGCPTVFLYDAVDGGLGFTRAMFEKFGALVRRTRDLIEACDCGSPRGCPACVMDYRCGNNNSPLHTATATAILNRLVSSLDSQKQGA